MLLSPPPLSLAKSSRSAASTAALRLLSRATSNSNPNPNPRFRRVMAMGAGRTALPGFPYFSNPKPVPLSPRHLHVSGQSPVVGLRGVASGSSAAYASDASLMREFGAGVEGPDADAPPPLVVVSFYRFADFPDHAAMREPLKDLCEEVRVSGGIILAPEGINGSICGTPESVMKVLNFIQTDERLKGLRLVESPVTPEDEAIHHGHTEHSPLAAGEDAPFRWDHVRVKLKKEIVTLGDPSIMPTKMVGEYVKPKDWNVLISDPDTVVIDVRNTYEIRIGKFKGAVDPCTTAFREFPSWVDDQFQLANRKESEIMANNIQDHTEKLMQHGEPRKLPRIAMYCTGGIRCEKASSLLLNKGFKEVYHLEGGILKYLEEMPKEESLWEGECFVFDKRVSVEHGLAQGTYKLCYGCKQPVSDADMESPEWEYGVSCPHCFATKSEEEKDRARARQRQFETWGVIGGPDKGRRNPGKLQGADDRTNKQLSRSM